MSDKTKKTGIGRENELLKAIVAIVDKIRELELETQKLKAKEQEFRLAFNEITTKE